MGSAVLGESGHFVGKKSLVEVLFSTVVKRRFLERYVALIELSNIWSMTNSVSLHFIIFIFR